MSIKKAITKTAALVVGFCFLFPAPAPSQQVTSPPDQITVATNSPVRTISGREKKELKRKLQASAEGDLKVLDAGDAPLAIGEARVRGVRIDAAPAGSSPPINDYAMQLSATLVNRESRSITGFGVEFANAKSNSVFYVYRHPVDIGVGKDFRLEIGFMAVTGDPSELAIRLVGVRFADEIVWGSFPLYPRNALLRLSPQPRSPSQVTPTIADEPVVGPVDSKPKLLTHPRPRYTEEARMNRVMGTVRARVLVGADGSVKQTRIIRALPDGLTDEAIRCAYELKFEPAKKNDQPVAFWVPVEIDFNLK